jgi:hypothetical protein
MQNRARSGRDAGINISAAHDIERARLRDELIEGIDIMRFPSGNADKRRNAAVQIE